MNVKRRTKSSEKSSRQTDFGSFAEFYPFYLSEHSNQTCRRLHFIGSCLVLVALAYFVATLDWWVLAVTPVVGYGFAWTGHFFFQRNSPATSAYPVYSLVADWVTFRDILIGRLKF